MNKIDAIVEKVMKEMGCDRSKSPHWVDYIYKFGDGRTMKDGYICSYCGKHSWSKKEKCDGCNSVMVKKENDNA